MNILIGLLIIAAGAFCQSSSYVPINKIKDWSWESYWIVQGVFAWLLLDTSRATQVFTIVWGLFSPFVVGAGIAFVFNVFPIIF